jgi:hypothetical protein
MDLEALIKIFHDNPKQQDIPAFPNVQHIILGQRSFWTWSSFGPIYTKENKLVTACSSVFDLFIWAHSPRSICTHSNQGPYHLDHAYLTTQSSKLEPMVTRHVYGHYEDAAIIPGTRNRWILYSGCTRSDLGANTTIYGQPAPPGYNDGDGLCRAIGEAVTTLHHMAKEIPTLVRRTSLEMYGQSLIGRSLQTRLRQAANGANEGGSIHEAARSTDPGVYARVLATYRAYCKNNLDAEVRRKDIQGDALYTYGYLPKGEEWPTLVKLLLWRDTPSCECCGWEMEDYMEELAAGLSPREAVLMRALMDPGA